MTAPLPDVDRPLWRGWLAAVADRQVADDLEGLLNRVEQALAAGPAVCRQSGRCCRFEQFGHRLYVTGLEIAYLATRLDEPARRRLAEADLPAVDRCPFQCQRRCTIHRLRPMGCRIFFCDPSWQDRQQQLYESFLADLRRLHRHHGLAYRYLEWRQGLAHLCRAWPHEHGYNHRLTGASERDRP